MSAFQLFKLWPQKLALAYQKRMMMRSINRKRQEIQSLTDSVLNDLEARRVLNNELMNLQIEFMRME